MSYEIFDNLFYHDCRCSTYTTTSATATTATTPRHSQLTAALANALKQMAMLTSSATRNTM
jgi:hypothetical protein